MSSVNELIKKLTTEEDLEAAIEAAQTRRDAIAPLLKQDRSISETLNSESSPIWDKLDLDIDLDGDKHSAKVKSFVRRLLDNLKSTTERNLGNPPKPTQVTIQDGVSVARSFLKAQGFQTISKKTEEQIVKAGMKASGLGVPKEIPTSEQTL